MRYFLDTDTLSLAHAGNASIRARIARAGAVNVATTVITAIEILRGRQDFLLKASDGPQLLHAQELLTMSQELLQGIRLVPVDASAAAEFDRVRQVKKLNKVGRADLLIASIALAHRVVLVTRNTRHFELVPGLSLEDWTE